MKQLLLSGVVLSLLSSRLWASAPDRYLLLPDLAPALTRLLVPEQVAYAEEDVAIIVVPFDSIEFWATIVHTELGGCGGFLDVTAKVEAGMAPEVIVWNTLLSKQIEQKSPEFLIEGLPEVATLVSKADGTKLWAFLTELSAFPDRSATSDQGTKAAQFLQDRASALATGISGFQTRKIETGSYPKQPSIVATLPGTDASLPHVVIGGHMDTFTSAKPGADDDGSGTSTVMEVFRAITTNGAKFRHTIDFIWYAAEERGLVGSSYVVDQFKKENIAVHAAIQFDMTGYNSNADDKDFYFITDYTNAALNEALKKLVATYLPEAKVGETKCGYACSDHVNWHQAGIPVVFPFETSFSNMNHRLHTGEDKIDYLDREHALRFAKLGLAFLGEMAKLEAVR